MDAVTFVSAHLGRAYEPAGLHCWELTRLCQRELFGRELPAVLAVPDSRAQLLRLMAERDADRGWMQIERPMHGAVVFLARQGHGVGRAACHAGTWLGLDGGGVLHTDEPHGVAFESLLQLAARNWAAPAFYVPRD